MNGKVYWSELQEGDEWGGLDHVGEFFYIPMKWWSWKAWKFMFEFRGHIHQKLIKRANSAEERP